MTFEFVVAYHSTPEVNIVELVRECLAGVLEANLNEMAGEDIGQLILSRSHRTCGTAMDDAGSEFTRALFAFALELPDDISSLRNVIDEFTDQIVGGPVAHVVRFEDPLWGEDLERWGRLIAGLEMKLRRVLTLVYLHAYQDGDPYNLLFEETIKLLNKDHAKPDFMHRMGENQFFHMTFSQYIDLNHRPELKFPDLLRAAENNQDYEGFRQELTRTPISDEDDAVLIAGLKQRMEAIESMRNCCAHSRRPSNKVIENFENVQPQLDDLLNQYLGRWELTEEQAPPTVA